MRGSITTHVQLIDADGHRPVHHVTETIPAGDPLRRKQTVRQRRVATGRVPREDSPEAMAAEQERQTNREAAQAARIARRPTSRYDGGAGDAA